MICFPNHVLSWLEMDSTSPVIFKRTKAKSAGRTRPTSPEPSKDGGDPEDPPVTLATKVKNKVKKSRPKSKLSFGGEEEVGEPIFLWAPLTSSDSRKEKEKYFRSKNQV